LEIVCILVVMTARRDGVNAQSERASSGKTSRPREWQSWKKFNWWGHSARI